MTRCRMHDGSGLALRQCVTRIPGARDAALGNAATGSEDGIRCACACIEPGGQLSYVSVTGVSKARLSYS